MPQHVRQLYNIAAHLVERDREQMPQIVWEHLARLHPCRFTNCLHFSPNLAARERLSAGGADNCTMVDTLCFCIFEKLAAELGVPYHIIPTQIGEGLFDIRKESNPCALCAKLRKGALDDKALEIGANKIAYAHHKDDLIETAFLSMLYEGRFYSFSPMTYLDRTKLTVIRPFIFIDEADIISFSKHYKGQGLPVCKNPCPMDGYTRRQYVKELLHKIYGEVPGADKRLFRAVIDGNIPGWPPANPNPRDNK